MSYHRYQKIVEPNPIERSKNWVRKQDIEYEKAMYRYVHADPDGNTDINRAIFRIKYPKHY